jgi:hypothetical protein
LLVPVLARRVPVSRNIQLFAAICAMRVSGKEMLDMGSQPSHDLSVHMPKQMTPRPIGSS